ncbi:MAG: YrzE family protein [Bacteroides sp.]|nr:YrzE family protein [Bacteroides sp.]
MNIFRFGEIKGRISWGSITAGVITVIAVSILLSILGSSIGLFMFEPTSENPASGIGTTIGIWTAICFLISLSLGGLVAGKLAGIDGGIHGFLVWGTTLIIALIFGIFLAVGAIKATGNILGSISSVAGSVLSSVGSVVESGVSGLANQAENIFGDIDIDMDENPEEIRANVRQALRRSGVRELQPEYIQNQLKGVKDDLGRAVKLVLRNPNDADRVIDGFTSRLSARVDKFTDNIDRDDITRAIANNSSMTKAEVDQTVDEYIEFRDRAVSAGKEQLENLRENIEQAKQQWQHTKQNALEEVEKASNKAAYSGIISFLALLVGAVLCSLTGSFGSKKTEEGYDV